MTIWRLPIERWVNVATYTHLWNM